MSNQNQLEVSRQPVENTNSKWQQAAAAASEALLWAAFPMGAAAGAAAGKVGGKIGEIMGEKTGEKTGEKIGEKMGTRNDNTIIIDRLHHKNDHAEKQKSNPATRTQEKNDAPNHKPLPPNDKVEQQKPRDKPGNVQPNPKLSQDQIDRADRMSKAILSGNAGALAKEVQAYNGRGGELTPILNKVRHDLAPHGVMVFYNHGESMHMGDRTFRDQGSLDIVSKNGGKGVFVSTDPREGYGVGGPWKNEGNGKYSSGLMGLSGDAGQELKKIAGK